MNRLLIGFTIVLACGVLVAQALAASSRTVGLRDNFITVSSSSAPHGAVTFSVTNRGANTHNFHIQRVSSGEHPVRQQKPGPRSAHLGHPDAEGGQLPPVLQHPPGDAEVVHGQLAAESEPPEYLLGHLVISESACATKVPCSSLPVTITWRPSLNASGTEPPT